MPSQASENLTVFNSAWAGRPFRLAKLTACRKSSRVLSAGRGEVKAGCNKNAACQSLPRRFRVRHKWSLFAQLQESGSAGTRTDAADAGIRLTWAAAIRQPSSVRSQRNHYFRAVALAQRWLLFGQLQEKRASAVTDVGREGFQQSAARLARRSIRYKRVSRSGGARGVPVRPSFGLPGSGMWPLVEINSRKCQFIDVIGPSLHHPAPPGVQWCG